MSSLAYHEEAVMGVRGDFSLSLPKSGTLWDIRVVVGTGIYQERYCLFL
jgi:hypothetical protein